MDSEPTGLAVPESDAGRLVAMGATIMRLENETLAAMAMQKPRDPRRVLEAALAELDLLPEEAGGMFYAIPYKDRKDDGSEETVLVEGPSIKLANALGRLWGHCAVGSRIVAENAEGATVEGVFLDYETGYRLTRQMQVSRLFKMRKGGVATLSAQRWVVALQAGASKAQRNAVLGGLPQSLVAAVLKRAKALVASGGKGRRADAALGKKAHPDRVAEALTWFGRHGITDAHLEAVLGAKATEWTGDHVAKLRGMKTALEEGQTTLEEMFSLAPKSPGTTDKATEAALPFAVADALGGTVRTSTAQPSADEQAAIARQEAWEEAYAEVSGLIQAHGIPTEKLNAYVRSVFKDQQGRPITLVRDLTLLQLQALGNWVTLEAQERRA